ncbi:MAG: GEVED domain-containing protein, partial [Cyanobacteria bacterium J06635_13]
AGCEPGAYELQLPVPTDYGDAPSTYGDAVHNIPASPGLYLGSVAPDGEVSTRAENTSGAADGDDDDNVDDDDAFASLADVPIVGNYSLNVPLTSNLGTATLHAWIDFNQNDVFDAEEYQSAAVAQNDTSANLTWAVPTGTVVGETYARFRLTSDTSINSSTPNGIATDGEVEDYPVTLSVPIYDYGDAPDTGVGTGTGNYQTTAADNGAAQVVINTAGQILSIGDAVDTDDGFAQNADATADDTLDAADDEDGITAFPTVTNEAGESFTVAVPVRNNVSSTDAFLVGYIDFNQDGEFTGPNERSNTATISPNANGDAQTVNLTFTTPGGMTPGTTFARLRLGQVRATAEQATGAAASTDNGEIEDYQITITSTPPQSNNSTSCTSPSSLISLASNLLNSANYPLDSALQNQVPLSFYNGTMKFSASLNGIGTWAGGVQVREDTSFGDHIFVQPRDTAFYRTSGNNATYVFSFPTSITDLSMILGGLNFADGTTISASYQGNPVQITAANFSNLSTGMSLLDDDGDGQSDTVVSSNTGGGTEVTNNIYTLSVPEPIDTLTVVSGKDNSFTSTATIGFALIGYCAELDYGDALISYDDSAGGGSIDQDDAPAAHGISNTLYLGSAAGDAETAPQSSASADGDDAIIGGTDDEDGIVAFPLLRENSTSYSLTATVNNTSSSAANVYAWIDFDGDGEFDEDERATIASDAIALDGNGKVPGGTNGTVKLNWDLSNSNVDLNTGDSYVRIRVTTSDLDLDTNETTNRDDSSVGLAVDGEVEDYIMAIAPAPLCPAARADVWFANDESGSVSSAEFENALDFLYQISDGFIYDDNTGIKAGITGWTDLVNSTEIVVPITESFGDPSDSGLFSDNNIALSINSQGIRELYSSKQNSSPGTRLDYATNYLADLITAGNGRRSNTPQVAVILTDADSSFINDPAQGGFTNWINEANQLRSEGAEIVLILIDEAKTAYDANPISKFIIDNVVGSNGKIITVPNYALAADSTQSYIESASQAICDLSTPNASDPGLLLVKRITAINPGQPGEIQFNNFVDDLGTTADNHPLWPDSDEDPSTNTNLYLRGVLNGDRIKPGDEVEYTVYFLSNGDVDARDVRICDVVPDHLTYVKDAYGLEVGISLGFNPTVVPTAPNHNLTNLLNDDEGDFYGAGTAPPSNLCKKVDENNNLVTVDSSNNDNGAIIVQPAPLLPPATSPGQPASSYGFIRFRGKVK